MYEKGNTMKRGVHTQKASLAKLQTKFLLLLAVVICLLTILAVGIKANASDEAVEAEPETYPVVVGEDVDPNEDVTIYFSIMGDGDAE